MRAVEHAARSTLRRRRLLFVVLLVLLVTQALGPGAGPAATTGPPRPLGVGMSTGDVLPWLRYAELERQLRDMAALGVDSVRMDFAWRDVQPTGPAEYTWTRLDRVVGRARAHGLEILAVLAYTPAWARPAGCASDKCAPADPRAFGAFARAAAGRYAARGVRHWEIWNEPNTPGFWQPVPDPGAYSRLLAAATTGIRREDGAAVVASGGLAAVRGGGHRIPALTFLDQMLTAGAGAHLDAVAYHPYTYPYPAGYRAPWPSGTAWNRIRDTDPSVAGILARHRLDRPIWVTEYGAPTGGPGRANDGDLTDVPTDTDHVTERWQAVLAADAVRTARATAGVEAFLWYTDRDVGAHGTSEDFYGLRRADGTAKPAWEAFRRTVTSRRGTGPP
jgi:hypothetical protein